MEFLQNNPFIMILLHFGKKYLYFASRFPFFVIQNLKMAVKPKPLIQKVYYINLS